MNTLIAIVLLTFQANVPPIGMILQSEGEVFVQRGTARTPAKLADLLYPGDQVVTATGQATFLFCPSAERASIKNGARVELGADAIVTRGGAAPTKVAARCTLPKVALGAENLERIGGLRARGDPPIIVFLGGAITTSRPTFEWVPAARAASYQLTVRDAGGATVWQQRLAAPASSLAYPQANSDLKAGAYQWELRAEADRTLVGEGVAAFEVKPSAELSRPPSDDAASRLIRVVELENAGYYAEAAAGYRAMFTAYPSDERIARRLVLLYWNAGLFAGMKDVMDTNEIK